MYNGQYRQCSFVKILPTESFLQTLENDILEEKGETVAQFYGVFLGLMISIGHTIGQMDALVLYSNQNDEDKIFYYDVL